MFNLKTVLFPRLVSKPGCVGGLAIVTVIVMMMMMVKMMMMIIIIMVFAALGVRKS